MTQGHFNDQRPRFQRFTGALLEDAAEVVLRNHPEGLTAPMIAAGLAQDGLTHARGELGRALEHMAAVGRLEKIEQEARPKWKIPTRTEE